MLQGDLFKRLSLDETFRRVCAVYTSGFAVFIKIAAVILVPNALLWALVLLPSLRSALGVTSEEVKDPMFAQEHPGAFSLLMVTNGVLAMIFGAVASGSFIKAVADLYVGNRPDWLKCLKVGVKKAPVLMLAALLALLGTMLGLVCLIVPGVYLMVAWCLYCPAVVLENKGPFGSLKRSRELVSGEWCYVFCTFLIVYAVMIVIQMLWSTIILGGSDGGHTLFSVVGSIIAMIPSLFIIPIFSIMQTVMYFCLRVEKEGLNAEVLSREMGESMEEASDYRQVPLMDEEPQEDEEVDSGSAV